MARLVFGVAKEGVDGGLVGEEALEEGQRVGRQRVHRAVRRRMLHCVPAYRRLKLLQRGPRLRNEAAAAKQAEVQGWVTRGQQVLPRGYIRA